MRKRKYIAELEDRCLELKEALIASTGELDHVVHELNHVRAKFQALGALYRTSQMHDIDAQRLNEGILNIRNLLIEAAAEDRMHDAGLLKRCLQILEKGWESTDVSELLSVLERGGFKVEAMGEADATAT